MTIINPNSIAGITSVTAEAGVMNFYKSDGTLAGLQLNGVNFNTTSGISTFNDVYVGGTITYEDVKNVDSVGIVTARDHIKITTDNKSLYLGASDDFQLFHNGSHNIIKSNNGNLYLQDADYIEIGDPSGKVSIGCVPSGATNLRHNGSTKIATTSSGATVTGDLDVTGNIDVADNVRIKLGTGDDMQIWHDGSTTKFSDSGSVLFYSTSFTVQSPSAENIIIGTQNGAVELYYDNVKTFYTNTNGAIVQATEGGDANLFFYADEGDDNADKWLMQSESDGFFALKNYASGSWETSIKATGNAAVELYYDNTKRFETSSTGATLNGALTTTQLNVTNGITANLSTNGYDIKFGDSTSGIAFRNRARFGAGEDMTIFHNGSHSYIQNSTGSLLVEGSSVILRSLSQENYLVGTLNGSVELYHDNSKKFETTSAGTLTQGDIVVTDAVYLSSASTISSRLTLNSENTSSWQGTRDLVAFDLIGNGADHRTGTLSIKIKRNPGDSSPTEMMRLDGVNNLTTFYTAAAERLRIDSSGRLMLGRTSASKLFNLRETSTSTGVHIVQTIGGNNHVSAYAVGLGFDPEGYAARTKIAIVAEGTGAGYSRGKLHFLLDSANDSGEATISESRMTITDSGDVGINVVSNGRSPLHIHQPASASTYLHMTNASTGNTNNDGFSIYVATDGQTYYRARESAGTHRFYTNGSERFRITSGGIIEVIDSVTLSSNAPSVKGKIRISGSSNATTAGGLEFHTSSGGGAGYGSRITSDSSGNMHFLTRSNHSAWSERVRITSAGKLLIGTTSSNAPNGSVHIANAFLRLQAGNQNSSDFSQQVGIQWSQESGSDVEVGKIVMRRDSWGGAPHNMDFYTRNYSNSVIRALILHYNQNASLTGSLTQNASDIRLKENIQPITNALEKVNSLSGFTFNWNKKGQDLGFTGEGHDDVQVGLSAQDVEKIQPEVVKPAPIDNDYKTIQYEKLVPLLLESIKELSTQVESLKEEITILKGNK